MIIEPSVGDSPRNGSAVMTRARSTAATVLPTNVARPPASAAPPSTAAVMLLSANELPIWALPIGERAMTKSAATAARTPERSSARTRIQLVLMPPRLAERSSKPTARTSRPDPEACSQRSSRPAPTTMTMNATGIGPTLVLSNDTRSSLMIPWAVGRRVSEIPSRMLSVAKVAMSDGILNPLISTALTNPRPRPQARIAAIPSEDLDRRGVAADQERADDDTEADHRPDRQVQIPDEDRMRLGDRRPAPGASPAAAPW